MKAEGGEKRKEKKMRKQKQAAEEEKRWRSEEERPVVGGLESLGLLWFWSFFQSPVLLSLNWQNG